MFNFILFVIFFLGVFPREVLAYLDPGTGSYITQIIIGFVLGGAFVGKKYFQQIASFFKGFFRQKKKDGQETED